MDQPLPGGAKPLGPHDPRTLGAHTVLGKLGQGGMGAVYLGRGPRGTVAIKVIRDELGADPGFRQRFAQEVAAGRRVASFCTAAMLDHGEDAAGHPYLVTEFIEGPTLHEHVFRHGALTEGTLQGFAVGVAAALTAIHGAGLVHRDLKPSNVILSVSGPRVIDFGIARALDATSDVTRTGQLIGTPGWIAPEQLLADRATTAVDIYTWGCLVAFAAQARHPFGGGAPIAMASRVLHGEPDLAGVPEPLLGHVRAAMAKDPALRPTAQQLLLALVGGGAPQQLDAKATALVEESVHGGWVPAGMRTPPPGVPATPPPFPGAPTAPGERAAPVVGPPGPHGLFPPPGPPPVTAAPRTRRLGRHRAWTATGGSVLAAAVAGAALLYVFSHGDDNSSSGAPAAANVMEKDGYRLLQLTRDTGIGQTYVDAGVELTVGKPRCGGTTYAGQTAQGEYFCLVPLIVRNPQGDDSDRVPRDEQAALDQSGQEIPATEYAGGFLNDNPTLAPGDRISGWLVFDMPKGTSLKSLRVHGSNGSQGVEVTV
ncbi:hypothetical protein GCM10022221_35910 [Actinocorallia aurea]